MSIQSGHSPEGFEDTDGFPEFDQDADEAKKDFEDWCEQNELDPEDEGAKEEYKEYLSEVGPSFWNDMDPNDRAGWEDNIIKWGE